MRGFGKGGFGGLGDIGKMMRQVQKAQADAERIQQELEEARVEASSGGGMVTAVCNGKLQVLDIRIKPEAIDPDDPELLQDMVLAAVQEAQANAEQMASEKMGALTDGLELPPGLGGLMGG